MYVRTYEKCLGMLKALISICMYVYALRGMYHCVSIED